MSQHDLTIDNQGFPAFRADLNSALQALGSCQSGTSAPATTFANQLWYDTTNNILKIRNEDNDAWISLLTLDQSGDLVAAITANALSSVNDASISGLTVGKGGGAVASNTAVGYQAGYSNTSGDLTALGYQALYSQTTGASNTAVGYKTAYTISSGTDNTAMGVSALRYTTTGSYNTAIGRDALGANTTASNNTAVGYQAGYSNTTGLNNVAVGRGALYSASANDYNTAVGDRAAYFTTGNANSAFGGLALYSNTSGSRNTAIGEEALQSNTTASNNTAVGYQAGYASTTGAYNTLVGGGAGYALNSNGNTIVGYQAGYSLTSGVGNTFVGANSPNGIQACGYYITTGSNNTILGGYDGNQGGLDIRTASNYIVLSDGAGNPRAYWNGANATFNGRLTLTSIGGGDETIQLNNNAASGTRYLAYFRVNASEVGSITTGGTTTAYNTSSDYRLKENVAPMTGALDKVAQLKPCTYTWKKDNSDGQGFIAHELAEIFPDAVAGEKDGVREDGTPVYQGVDASFLVATLVSAIQELNAKVDAQALEIAALKGVK